jgi:hypothetical protein
MKKEEIESLEKRVSDLSAIIRSLENKVNRFDLYPDAHKHYGFNGEKMYYIGIATGFVYSKPISESILKDIESLRMLSSEAGHRVNKYFMGIE